MYCQPQPFTGVAHIHLLPKQQTKQDLVKRRREKFKNELAPYVETYGRELMNAFYKYWSELNKSQSRMRWELERTWQLNLRLARWDNSTKMGTQKTSKEFIFSKKVQDTLRGQELSDYWRLCRENGYQPKKDHLGNIIDWIKPISI